MDHAIFWTEKIGYEFLISSEGAEMSSVVAHSAHRTNSSRRRHRAVDRLIEPLEPRLFLSTTHFAVIGDYGTASALASTLLAMTAVAVYLAFRLSGRRDTSFL